MSDRGGLTAVAGLIGMADGALMALRIARGALESHENARDHALGRVRYARDRLNRLRAHSSVLTPGVLQEVDDGIHELDSAEQQLTGGVVQVPRRAG